LDDLPPAIKRQIIVSTDRTKVRDNNHLDLTECIGCLRKAWFKRKFPLSPSLRQRWYFYRGNVFDDLWTPLFERNQVRVTHRIRNSKYPVVIAGRLDFLDEEKFVADLKTTDKIENIRKYGAKEDNVKQLMFYCWYEATTKGRLYYISFKDAEMFEFDFKAKELEELVDEIEERAMVLYDSLLTSAPPPKDEKHTDSYWECNLSRDGEEYCEYRNKCKESK
jgi:hypothetical protein